MGWPIKTLALAALLCAAGAGVTKTEARAQLEPYTPVDLTLMVGQLRLEGGEMEGGLSLKGAFRVAPGGMIQWYFANVGLFPFVEVMPVEVRDYLDAYIRVSEATTRTDRIYDIELTPGAAPRETGRIAGESDDAYAASFLRLAARYVQVTGDRAWWARNLQKLKATAINNLEYSRKTAPIPGLVRTFQDPSQPRFAPAVGYLMDNAEVYAGLRDFVAVLRQTGDPDAERFARLADGVRRGVARLFDARGAQWRVSDLVGLGKTFYPDATAQIFPELYDVPAESPQLQRFRYDSGWRQLNRLAPDWHRRAYDDYPWVTLAHAAARRGEREMALESLRFVRANFPFSSGRLTIMELGHYMHTLQELEGP